MNSTTADAAITRWTGDAMQSRLRSRYRSERAFKWFGFAAVAISLGFLVFLLGTMLWKGAGGLTLDFLQASDSTDAATAGVWGALKGSFLTILVTIALAFPVGVLSAIYLEEFAPRNRWTDIIEVSINNLAAVPSIIFGLLGLAVFLNFMHLPRSAPLVGGLTLALMTMPVIVIAGRNAITVGAALDPRGRARRRRLEDAGGLPPRASSGTAGNPDRHDHRHGARAWRNRAAADDRHARLHRRPAVGHHRARDRSSGPDLPMVGRSRPRPLSRRPAPRSSSCSSSCC